LDARTTRSYRIKARIRSHSHGHGYGEEFAALSLHENVALAPNDFIHRLIGGLFLQSLVPGENSIRPDRATGLR
jgi:hypothetical protein